MALEIEPITNKEFVQRFENQTLAPEYFDHLGHIRLARLYLLEYELDQAISQISQGIQDYARSLGAADKFHLTITDAIMRIINKRLAGNETDDWESFLDKNSDIVEDSLSVLYQYYSEDVLMSDKAKRTLVLPDKRDIEEC